MFSFCNSLIGFNSLLYLLDLLKCFLIHFKCFMRSVHFVTALLFGLFADVGKNTAVNIQDVTVYSI